MEQAKIMAGKFPDDEWLQTLMDKLNQDERYARVARNWEGDMVFDIEPDDQFPVRRRLYLDLWHGKCREAYPLGEGDTIDAKYVLVAPYGNFVQVLDGKIDAIQAMITRKLKVQGSMAYMMRNVPVVLDFVRCAREITSLDET